MTLIPTPTVDALAQVRELDHAINALAPGAGRDDGRVTFQEAVRAYEATHPASLAEADLPATRGERALYLAMREASEALVQHAPDGKLRWTAEARAVARGADGQGVPVGRDDRGAIDGSVLTPDGLPSGIVQGVHREALETLGDPSTAALLRDGRVNTALSIALPASPLMREPGTDGTGAVGSLDQGYANARRLRNAGDSLSATGLLRQQSDERNDWTAMPFTFRTPREDDRPLTPDERSAVAGDLPATTPAPPPPPALDAQGRPPLELSAEGLRAAGMFGRATTLADGSRVEARDGGFVAGVGPAYDVEVTPPGAGFLRAVHLRVVMDARTGEVAAVNQAQYVGADAIAFHPTDSLRAAATSLLRALAGDRAPAVDAEGNYAVPRMTDAR